MNNLKELERQYEELGKEIERLKEIERRLEEFEAADVQEVKHGKWELSAKWKNGDISAKCSLCSELFIVDKYYGLDYIRGLYIYCPHCGAKMDGKE